MTDNIHPSKNFQQDREKTLNSSVFQRSPHDKQNPYCMNSRELIQNPELSFEARGMLMYFLSHQDGWQIRSSVVISTQKITKERFYKIVNELIEKGYVHREEYFAKNLRRYRYWVSEQPNLKKFFRYPGFPDVENPDLENPDSNKEQISTSKEVYINKQQTTKAPPDAVDELTTAFKKGGLDDDQAKRAKSYYETNMAELQASKDNPIGFVVWAIRNDKDKEMNNMQEKIRQRKEFARSMNSYSQCGYTEATEDGLEIVSGTIRKIYSYDSDHQFWERYDL